MAAIVRSGGNQFHGGGSWAQNTSHFQSDNIDERLADLNGNFDYDPGEVNLDRNGRDFVETLGKRSQGTALPPPPPINVVNPSEGQPKYDELSVSLERELIPNLALKGTAVYSRTTNVIGPTGVRLRTAR